MENETVVQAQSDMLAYLEQWQGNNSFTAIREATVAALGLAKAGLEETLAQQQVGFFP